MNATNFASLTYHERIKAYHIPTGHERNGLAAASSVTGISSRYCAACQQNHACYCVTWEDGKKTKPCTKSVKVLPDGTLQLY